MSDWNPEANEIFAEVATAADDAESNRVPDSEVDAYFIEMSQREGKSHLTEGEPNGMGVNFMAWVDGQVDEFLWSGNYRDRTGIAIAQTN